MWHHILMAELAALVMLALAMGNGQCRPKYKGEVRYDLSSRPTIQIWFTLGMAVVIHQLVFACMIPIYWHWQLIVSLFGISIFGSGFLLNQWSFRTMRDWVLPPMSVAPPDEAALITHGPYALSRNPMYVSYWLIFVGAQLMTYSPFILLAPTVATTFRRWVEQEENDQHQLHGDAFMAYSATTPRWFSWQRMIDHGAHTLLKNF